MRQIAELHTIPIPGQSFLAQETLDYAHAAPMPYAMDRPGQGMFGGLNYAEFFSQLSTTRPYVEKFRRPHPRPAYQPSFIDNWEAQHPPLYYLLMAPALKATDALSVVTQFFLLRLLSFALAMGGLLVGLRAALRYFPALSRRAVWQGYLLYPLVSPIFISEFARLGNDALCLLIMSLLWTQMLRWQQQPASKKQGFRAGLWLALGLLTKALFIPVLAGYVLFHITSLWRCRRSADFKARLDSCKACAVPVLFGGLWYVYKWKAFGALSGSLDEAFLAQNGGLWHGLGAHFAWPALGHLFLVTIYTWFWSGTASQFSLSLYLATPALLLNIMLAGLYVKRSSAFNRPVFRLPVWIYGALLAALVYFELICLALDSRDSAPGWYLNAMLPLAGLVCATGWSAVQGRALWRHSATVILVCNALLWLSGLATQTALVSGCLVPGSGFIPNLAAIEQCWRTPQLLYAHLSVLVWPQLATICLIIAVVLAAGSRRLLIVPAPHAD